MEPSNFDLRNYPEYEMKTPDKIDEEPDNQSQIEEIFSPGYEINSDSYKELRNRADMVIDTLRKDLNIICNPHLNSKFFDLQIELEKLLFEANSHHFSDITLLINNVCNFIFSERQRKTDNLFCSLLFEIKKKIIYSFSLCEHNREDFQKIMIVFQDIEEPDAWKVGATMLLDLRKISIFELFLKEHINLIKFDVFNEIRPVVGFSKDYLINILPNLKRIELSEPNFHCLSKVNQIRINNGLNALEWTESPLKSFKELEKIVIKTAKKFSDDIYKDENYSSGSICPPEIVNYGRLIRDFELISENCSNIKSLKIIAPLLTEYIYEINTNRVGYKVGLEHFNLPSLKSLKIEAPLLRAEFFHFTGFTSLTLLDIFVENNIQDKEFQHLAGLTNLVFLALRDFEEHVDITFGDITEEGIRHLSALTNLKYLEIGWLEMCDIDIFEYFLPMTNLLTLSMEMDIDEDSQKKLSKLTTLKNLVMTWYDTTMDILSPLTNLEYLCIGCDPIETNKFPKLKTCMNKSNNYSRQQKEIRKLAKKEILSNISIKDESACISRGIKRANPYALERGASCKKIAQIVFIYKYRG